MQLSYLKELIDEFGKEVAKAAAEVINDVILDTEKEAKENLRKHGIKGTRMYEGFTHTEADWNADNPEATLALEVWSDEPTKKIGNNNSGIYDSMGYANVGRIIEFSPRINKPFYYDAFYKRRKGMKKEIHDKVVEVIRNVNRQSQ